MRWKEKESVESGGVRPCSPSRERDKGKPRDGRRSKRKGVRREENGSVRKQEKHGEERARKEKEEVREWDRKKNVARSCLCEMSVVIVGSLLSSKDANSLVERHWRRGRGSPTQNPFKKTSCHVSAS